ncbi:hypothetical protein BY458DRAFT_527475 [Sporodiniella umbellata]|nr:hypothetical protein BY458DRAFT_527475 [Sporodiniella umbellata]
MIANPLLLSRAWHSVHILDSFVKFDYCGRPRQEGGLVIPDSFKQHKALQLRWLLSLLLHTEARGL